MTNTETSGPAPSEARSRFGVSSLFRQGVGPPVLVLHAAGGAGMWNPYLDRLSENFDVIAPDHPGFGSSPALDGVDSIATLVEHYLSLLDSLGLDRVHVVGASLGGWLAAEIACTAPERIDRLVLMAPPGILIPEAPPGRPVHDATRRDRARPVPRSGEGRGDVGCAVAAGSGGASRT